jgi:Zn-dependent protease/predicted transcriptional regulator
MKATIHLGRWFGVPVGLHYSWFIIAGLITVSLVSAFHQQNPAWGPIIVWATAVAAALIFFVCIALHELAHAMVARMGGLQVRGITLFALGGVAQISREASSPSWEFGIAVVGPIASAIIGLACQIAAAALGWQSDLPAPSPLAGLLGWLGFVNIVLAIFNLIPGFPLDGGRMLRAAIWAFLGDADRATRIAAAVGQGIAFMLIAIGISGVLLRGDFGGLWLSFIGWFLLEAARANYVAAEINRRLRGVRVADLVTRNCAQVGANATVEEVVNAHLLDGMTPCFVVGRDGQPIAVLTSEQLSRMPRASRAQVTVDEIVRPLNETPAVDLDTPATTALEVMNREHVTQLPVVDHGHLEGVVAQSNILRRLQLEPALKA